MNDGGWSRTSATGGLFGSITFPSRADDRPGYLGPVATPTSPTESGSSASDTYANPNTGASVRKPPRNRSTAATGNSRAFPPLAQLWKDGGEVIQSAKIRPRPCRASSRRPANLFIRLFNLNRGRQDGLVQIRCISRGFRAREKQYEAGGKLHKPANPERLKGRAYVRPTAAPAGSSTLSKSKKSSRSGARP